MRRRRVEHRPRARREVLQPRADRDDEVGLRHDDVGGSRARDADRSCVPGMVGEQARLACDGLDDRDAELLGERRELLLRARVVDAAARDDDRPLRRPDRVGRAHDLSEVRPRPRDLVHLDGEELLGVVVGVGRDVLRQADERRAAVRGVEQRADGLRQRAEDLRGVHDAVPVAHDRAEAVVHRRRRGRRSAPPAAAPDRAAGTRTCRRR